MADWNKIKAEYIAGGTSYRKLAEKHGVSFNTLKTRAIEEQWYKLRQQSDHETTTKIVKDVSKKNAKIDDKYFRLVDMLIWQPTGLKELATTMKYLKECKGVKSEADMREQEARIAKLIKEAQDDSDEDIEVKVTMIGDLDKYSK